MDISKVKMPVAVLCTSKGSVEGLVGVSGGLSKGGRFVLLLNDRVSSGRLLPALVSACVRFQEKVMRADTLQKETLLFAAGTMNIGRAIREAGITSASSFKVFASDGRVLSAFIDRSGSRVVRKCKLRLDKNVASEVAAAGIGQE